MNTFIPPALDAADLLALARLDDDGEPQWWVRHSQPTARPATRISWPARISGPPARRKRPGRNIARARKAAPAGLGVG